MGYYLDHIWLTRTIFGSLLQNMKKITETYAETTYYIFFLNHFFSRIEIKLIVNWSKNLGRLNYWSIPTFLNHPPFQTNPTYFIKFSQSHPLNKILKSSVPLYPLKKGGLDYVHFSNSFVKGTCLWKSMWPFDPKI